MNSEGANVIKKRNGESKMRQYAQEEKKNGRNMKQVEVKIQKQGKKETRILEKKHDEATEWKQKGNSM